MADNRTSLTDTAKMTSPWYLVTRVLISFSSVVGNSLVIYLVTSVSRLHMPPNWFVLSLAVADLSVGLFLTPIDFVLAYCAPLQWYLEGILDVVYDYVLDVAAVNLLALICDRYLAITQPLRYHTIMTNRRAILIIIIAWVVPAILGLPFIVFIFQEHFVKEQEIYTSVLLFLFQFLPSVLMLFAYLHIYLIVRRHLRQTVAQMAQVEFNQTQHIVVQRRTSDHVTVKLVGVLVLVFAVCYMLTVYKNICFIFDLCHVPPITDKISLSLIHLNSFANFLVYALIKKDIRKELKTLLRCT